MLTENFTVNSEKYNNLSLKSITTCINWLYIFITAAHLTLSTELVPELKKTTPQYQRLFSTFPTLVTALTPMVGAAELADKLYFSTRLITESVWEEASVGGVINSTKIRLLMKSVLSQVELNAANYEKFVTVLREFDGLQEIVELLETV